MNDQIFPVKKCNGVMGVPITFLDKYDPQTPECDRRGCKGERENE